jgi:beta-lactamase regulating signal transducer with metallopeptidase domain
VVRTKGHRARFLSSMNAAISRLVTAVHRYQSTLVVAWMMGMAVMGGVRALGSRAVRRICREARPAPAGIRERAARLARRARLRKPPRVMVHPCLREPCLGGLWRPVILLPEAWLDCREGELIDAILAHELAHARRLDHLVNPVQRLLESTFFFNPAVHWLSRSLRRQREFCADALAVRLTRDPLALAQALESVARLRLAFPDRPAVGSALGGQSVSLLPRIQELIGMTPTRPRPRLWPFAALPAAGLIALITAASGLSQEKPAAVRTEAPLTTMPNGGQNGLSIAASSRPVSRYGPPKVPAPADFDRQICYEIRYLSLDANPWREAVKDHLKLINQEADVCAWIIDDKSVPDLLNSAQDATSNVFQAPKVTTFENAHALISDTYKKSYISQFEKVETAAGLVFRPVVKECELGRRIDVVGSFTANGTAVVANVRDSSLVSLHTLVRRETFRNQKYAADYQVPTAIERNCRVSCEVPDSGSLLISMGLHERRGRLSNAGETASGLLEAVGLPPVPARAVISERLVMITPRRIVLEAEKPQTAEIKGKFDGRTR